MSAYLILEAFENEIPLHVLKFLYLLLLFEFIVFHCSTDIVWRFFRMEHVGTKVQDSLLVNDALLLRLLSTKAKTWFWFFFFLCIEGILYRIPLNKFRDFLNKLAFFDNLVEALFAQVTQTDKKMHEHTGGDVLFEKA